MYNPCIRGWINYYSHFCKTQLRPTLKRIDAYVIRWARRKFRRLRHQTKGARDWFDRLRLANPNSSRRLGLSCLLIYLKGSSWLTPPSGRADEKPTRDRRCEDQNGRSQRSFERSSRSTRTICGRSSRSYADALIEARRARFRPLRGTDCCLVPSSKSLRAFGAGRKPSLPISIIVQLCRGFGIRRSST
jgi:hypothetical protein